MAGLKHPARGIMFARADASNPTAILAQLQSAVEEMKQAHAEQIAGVNAKFDDVVTRNKLDAVNAHVGTLQASLDEMNAKLANAQLNGGNASRSRDPEYTQAFAMHVRKGDVQASLNKGADAEGGYVAPTEWDRTITDKLIEVSPMRQICRVQTISTGSFSKLFNLRGTSSGWVGETAARPATDTGTFGQLVYRVGEIYANPAATQQLLDDALVDLESWLAGEVQTEFAYQENLAFVSGSGANNRPNGLLTYITGGANAAAHPFGAVTATNTGAAAALTGDGIVNLAMALPSAFTANARFIMNRNTMAAVRLLKDGQGNYLWQASYQAGTPQTLAGYAMVEVPAMPDVAAGAKPIVFGDFDQGYLIVDGIGTRILRDPYTNKPFVQFYTTKRVGGGLLNPEALKAQNVAA
ncbi:phage major capsid protein [uncultured Roseovarius sp.]|uniref:phage major capsid protein n=1 Tax=uncultured Roseovarius sp. TaxID=293344 RepID=UPI000C581B20|nr:phage major capsid protein [Roseovarius sp.]|tara:strand:- start:187 stop:1416 length:1230 start_codon:yes stop_codon:yes gene_type:complete